jgi:hypothetical protein
MTGMEFGAAPRLPVHHVITDLRKECRTPFRRPLHLIVMSVIIVISVTFPHTYRGFLMTVS